VELIALYDDPRADEFGSILSLFAGSEQMPGDALLARPVKSEPPRVSVPQRRLVSLRLRSTQTVEALVDPPVTPDGHANLVVYAISGRVTIPLAPHARGLIGHLSPELQLGSMTLFAHAEGMSGGILFFTEPRWIDNDGLLERAARPRTVDPSLEDLSRRSLLGMSRQRILEAIQTVSAELLHRQREDHGDTTSHSAHTAPTGANSTPNAAQSPHAVDPSAMIRSLNEIRRVSPWPFGARGAGFGGGLGGVISMLFVEDEPDDIDLTRETWSAAEPEKSLDKPPTPPVPPTQPPEEKQPSKAAELLEAVGDFRNEINLFLHALGKPAFAATCDAPRMVQALAFPLLLCIRGSEAGWLPTTELATVATRVTDVMFSHVYERAKPRGLFAIVRDRYAKLGRLEDFLLAVGDGTLWTALLAALSIDPSAQLRTVLPQASALASVFHCRELLANSNAVRLSGLVRSLLIQNAEHHITEKAENIAQAATTVVTALLNHWEALYQKQGSGRRLQPSKALMWSRDWGWKVTSSMPAQAYCPGYINVEAAAADYPDIQYAVKQLLEVSR